MRQLWARLARGAGRPRAPFLLPEYQYLFALFSESVCLASKKDYYVFSHSVEQVRLHCCKRETHKVRGTHSAGAVHRRLSS
jgi:hypothetical protein